jgi:hypothetical protein
MKVLFLFMVMVQMAACTGYTHTKSQSVKGSLDSAQGVLISVPENGSYGNDVYGSSGKMTADAVAAAFSKYAIRVDIDSGCKREACLKNIDTSMYGYFVNPTILHWEERATEWSGLPDRIEVKLEIFDTVNRQQIGVYSYAGKSKWATFGGDHPQDLLPQPTGELVSSLYHDGVDYISAPIDPSLIAPDEADSIQELGSGSDDTYDTLLKLDDLRNKGIITDEEFEREKNEVLSEN